MILGFAIILTVMLLAVIVFDATQFIIPNELNLGFVLIYPVFIMLTPEHIQWWWAIAVMGGFLLIGFLLFMTNIIGGGDIKLLVALSLWIGWDPATIARFGIWTALAGGVLALVLIVARIIVKIIKAKKAPRAFRWKEPLPYGLAIAYAFGYLLWTGQITGLKVPV